MAVVRLRGPVKTLAAGRGEHAVEGGTVVQALHALEAAEPGLNGWILDERGRVRRHINVFVAGEYDSDRVTPEGRVRVYETRDAGASWSARGDGLPQEHAYLTVLRQAFDAIGAGPSLELYFGATSGDVFGSGDAGAGWFTAATRLPPVLSVTAG